MTRAPARTLEWRAGLWVLLSLGLFWFSPTVADPDLWGHVRFGQDIVRSRSIIQQDVYSYRSGDQRWINHEWLSEVVFALLYDQGGPTALILFKVLVSLVIFGLCHTYLCTRGLGPWRAALLLLLVSVPLRMGLGTIRPQLFTYLFLLVELLLLATAATGLEYQLWAVPALLAIWANLHGGVLAGIGVLCLWVLGFLVRRRAETSERDADHLASNVRLASLVGASVLALLVNPYGFGLVQFLLRTATVPRPEISEWSPLGLLSMPGLVYLVLVVTGTAGLTLSRIRPTAQALLILSATAVLTLISSRHFPLFALALVVMAGEPIADVWNRATPQVLLRLGQSRWLAALGLVLAILLAGASIARFSCIRIDPFYFAFPARAVELLKRSHVHGNIAVHFDWGEYLIWHLGPAIKVSTDGRRETVYSERNYKQSLAFAHGDAGWDRVLTEPRADLVLVPNGAPPVGLLARAEGWLPLYQDSFCVMFVRAEYAGIDPIMACPVPALPDNGDGLCFPVRGTERDQGRKATTTN